jgi:hypothetical protein
MWTCCKSQAQISKETYYIDKSQKRPTILTNVKRDLLHIHTYTRADELRVPDLRGACGRAQLLLEIWCVLCVCVGGWVGVCVGGGGEGCTYISGWSKLLLLSRCLCVCMCGGGGVVLAALDHVCVGVWGCGGVGVCGSIYIYIAIAIKLSSAALFFP